METCQRRLPGWGRQHLICAWWDEEALFPGGWGDGLSRVMESHEKHHRDIKTQLALRCLSSKLWQCAELDSHSAVYQLYWPYDPSHALISLWAVLRIKVNFAFEAHYLVDGNHWASSSCYFFQFRNRSYRKRVTKEIPCSVSLWKGIRGHFPESCDLRSSGLVL